MIPYMATQLECAKLSETDRELVDCVPFELRAVDFVTENDLQYTAMLEQIWVRLLAIHVAQQRPDRANAARGIAATLGDVGDAVTSDNQVLDQLLELQARLLKLWMLFSPANDEEES